MSDSGLPDNIVESVATSNVASIGEQPAILANLALGNLVANVNLAQQNAVSNQQVMNDLTATVLGKLVNMLTSLGPMEAAATEHLFTDNAPAEAMAIVAQLRDMLEKQKQDKPGDT